MVVQLVHEVFDTNIRINDATTITTTTITDTNTSTHAIINTSAVALKKIVDEGEEAVRVALDDLESKRVSEVKAERDKRKKETVDVAQKKLAKAVGDC
ncbi:MAG: hypothetical protein LE178_01925 [Endomicrobium sp.]|nr:hypothetical protein [Endomicrobium sp.]